MAAPSSHLRPLQMVAHLRDFTSRRLAVVAVFLCLSLATGLIYSLIIPPWQAPDEPRHLEYAIRLWEKGWFLTRQDTSADLQREMMTAMLQSGFWTLLGREEPDSVPDSFLDDPFLRLSGTQLGDESPLYYLLPALAFNVLPEGDLLARLYLMRWYSVLLSAAAVAVACLTAFELFPEDRFMIVAVPAFMALLPMFSFIGASANNDVLAVLLASLVVWQLVKMFNSGLTWRSGLTLCVLATLSLLGKKTSLFTVPLVPVAIAADMLHRRLHLNTLHRRAIATSSVLGLLLLATLLSRRGGDAAHWLPWGESLADTRSDAVARSGSHALEPRDGRLTQALPFNTVRALRGKTVTLEAWTISPGARQRGSLVIEDDQGQSMKVFVAGSGWRRQELTHEVAPSARTLRVILDSSPGAEQGGEGLYFDDLSLLAEGRQGRNWLENCSAETPALRIERHLDGAGRYLSPSQLLDPRSYDSTSLRRYVLYTLLTFAGFWANFGWLTLPLDMGWYALLALATLVSCAGLALWGVGLLRRALGADKRAASLSDTVLLVFLVGLALLALQTFLPMIGSQWQPQGRYLFSGLVIVATLFAFGLRRLMKPVKPKLLAAGYLICFLLFDALCLVGYIIPYYYG
jgi:hypothetical protein